MKLDDYRRKRDQARTNEPFGEDPVQVTRLTREGAYVVHLHDATRRHYDLRLEVGGVLASFAVPRGPSLDPKERRLAVRTEDHPIEYLDFEAVIPPGNYGAGAMILWDRGRVRYLHAPAEEGFQRGKLDIEVHGHKLHGVYTLVRTRRDEKKGGGRGAKRGSRGAAGSFGGAPEGGDEPSEWLLIKKADGFASAERDLVAEAPRSVLSGLTVEELDEAPRITEALEARAAALGAPLRAMGREARIAPMLCAPGRALPEGAEWLYELKLDGVRVIAMKEPSSGGARVTLTGRRRTDMTSTYPEVVRAVQALAARRVVLDGEVVALNETGQPSFQRLGGRIHLQRAADVRLAMREIPVMYIAFDLLALGDRDLRPLPLVARKELLRALIPAPGVLRALDFLEGNGAELLAFCRERRLEGIVAKRRQSPYREGTRTDDWVKLKCERDDEFVIVGWTKGEGGRARLGALDLASYDKDQLIYRGKVGSGFDERSLDQVLASLAPLVTGGPVAEGEYVPAPRGRTHVRPEAVASVRYIGFSNEGQIRHGVFRGLRDDVPPRACTAGSGAQLPPDLGEAEVDPDAPPDPEPPPSADAASAGAPAAPPRRVAITNPRKVLWPGEGITKTDLCHYYEAIAPAMLPHLADRPVMLVRYPDGIQGKHFYQWNVPLGVPSWIRRYRIESEDRGDINEVFLVDDAASLVYVANLGAIPIHVLAGRVQNLNWSDFLTIDFDVKLSTLDTAIALALTLRGILDKMGLLGFPKTSGQSGLHVLVPLGPGVSHESARALADLLGRLLVQRHPDTATMERIIAKRGKRVYVDTGQTGRFRTIVAPYSLRAQPGARVSTPLRWDEVELGLDPARFDLRTVPARVAEQGDPMAGLLKVRPDLPRAMERLEALVQEDPRR